MRIRYEGANEVTEIGPRVFQLATMAGAFLDSHPDADRTNGCLSRPELVRTSGSPDKDDPSKLLGSTYLGGET